MNYANIIQELDNASSFDIFRLSIALNHEIESYERILEIKSKLIVGQNVDWFNATNNRLEKAVVIKCNKSRVLLENISDGLKWNVQYCAINLDSVEVEIAMNKKTGVKKYELSLGDVVSFIDNFNKLIYGKVIKLNPKTAKIDTGSNFWKVYYENITKADDMEAELVKNKIFIDM